MHELVTAGMGQVGEHERLTVGGEVVFARHELIQRDVRLAWTCALGTLIVSNISHLR